MKDTRKLAVISVAVALAVVLDYVKEFLPFLNMPFGGSINIALIPIVMISFIYNWKEGILTGFLWWMVSTLFGMNNWFISVPQYLCDYILPSILPGMSSLIYIRYKDNETVKEVSGILISFVFRAFVLVFSGACFWPEDGAALSLAAWSYSLTYNLPYNLATAAILCIVVPLIIKRVKSIVIR